MPMWHLEEVAQGDRPIPHVGPSWLLFVPFHATYKSQAKSTSGTSY